MSPLHIAASCANKTAIQMIQEHVEEYWPKREVPYNIITTWGTTPLDYSASAVKDGMHAEGDGQVDPQVPAMYREHAISCYQLLRQNGALHSFELKGIFIT
jgi:hypothetical protein